MPEATTRQQCTKCLRPAQPRHKLCCRCAGYAKKYYDARIAAGLCTEGGCSNRTRPGRRTCHDCVAKQTVRAKRYRHRIKDIINQHYGNICNCCGESNPLFLTLDHVNNDGNKQRAMFTSEMNLYIDVAVKIKRGDAPTDLRILCYNCNCGRQRNNGICPHEESHGHR